MKKAEEGLEKAKKLQTRLDEILRSKPADKRSDSKE